jgi:hypothetical protein
MKRQTTNVITLLQNLIKFGLLVKKIQRVFSFVSEDLGGRDGRFSPKVGLTDKT